MVLDMTVGQQRVDSVKKNTGFYLLRPSLPVRGCLVSVLRFFLFQKAVNPFFPAMLGFSSTQAFKPLSTAY